MYIVANIAILGHHSDQHWSGRNSQNTVVVFDKENYKIGDFVNVKIKDCTSATLIGEPVGYSDNN